MLKSLDALIDLQKIDAEIHALQQQTNSIDKDIENRKNKLSVTETESGPIRDKYKDMEASISENNLDIQTREDRIKKLKELLKDESRPKEVAAIDAQIKTFSKEINEKREKKKRMEKDLEKMQADFDRVNALFEEQQSEIKNLENTRTERLKEIEKSIAALDKQRTVYTTQTEQHILDLYDTIRRKYPDNAIVSINNNACGGCYLTLPPQEVNNIMLNDKINRCVQCGRVLYYIP